MEQPTINNRTPVKVSLGLLLGAIGFAFGFQPIAVAQIRSVVQEENKIIQLQSQATSNNQFSALRAQVAELTGEVRALRLAFAKRK